MRAPSPALVMSDAQREILESLAKSQTAAHREVTRAKALLLAADGLASTAVAYEVGVSPSSVVAWRSRFAEEGLAKLGRVRPGRGRKPQIPAEKIDEIVRLTQESKPEGETHWSCRTVQRVWSARGLKPHLVRTFKLSNDRRFDEKLIDRRRPLTNRLALMTDGDWRDGGFRQRRPSVETLAWVAASMGRGSRIVGYRRLTGGVCSAVNRLTVERRGMRTFVVLRQYPGGLGLQGSLEKEIANLGVVAGSGLPVPSILATDVAGASTGGAPSLLMTRLQGHVHLNPAEPRSWMTRIAEIAVLLHSLDLPAKMFRPWTDSWIAPLDGFQVPVDAQKPAVWKAAFGVMAAPPPKDTAVFLHCDLLPVNMLWSRGRITGLTDWNSIHRGARAIDVGHCRRYLAALYSPEWSEQLRSLYESIAGVTLDPWWDLYALLHYDDSGPKWIRSQVAGRRPVDVPGMTSRVEVAIETALRRLG